MKWLKLGRIFNPAEHLLPMGCTGFAQAPQALVLDGFVRIYFSTRVTDSTGKFLSHIAFVDFEEDFKTVIRVSSRPVIRLGDLGCFDEHGIFPMSVLRHGNRVYGYTCGWSRRVSVSVETAIGLAISEDDGLTFERIGPGPVLAAAVNEPCLVGDGYVRVIGDVFHMWYIFGIGWKRYLPSEAAERIYKIGHATSKDGINWESGGGKHLIPDRIGNDECQALPSVIDLDGRHHMFFCYRQPFGFRKDPERGYRIGHAWSDDLDQWVRDDFTPSLEGTPGDWDSDMQCYPNVFRHRERTYLLYNGNEFGRHGFGLAVLEC